MMSVQLEQALKNRELLRVTENGLDVRLYDTGQILALGNVTKEKCSWEGKKRIIEEVEVPAGATYNPRTGVSQYWLDVSSGASWGYPNLPFFSEALELLKQRGADLSKSNTLDYEDRNDPKVYPELTDFVEDVHESFGCRKWERHELAITGFLPTLKGHGNMHPLALLNPLVIAAYIAGTIFPFERITVFEFEKGRRNVENREDYLPTEEGKSYDGNAVLIRPWSLRNPDNKYFPVIEAHFFNPANYQKFLNDELSVENPLPARRDWRFNVSYGVEHGRKWLQFYCHKFRKDIEQREGFAESKEHDVYLKVNDKLMNDLEKIASLPLG